MSLHGLVRRCPFRGLALAGAEPAASASGLAHRASCRGCCGSCFARLRIRAVFSCCSARPTARVPLQVFLVGRLFCGLPRSAAGVLRYLICSQQISASVFFLLLLFFGQGPCGPLFRFCAAGVSWRGRLIGRTLAKSVCCFVPGLGRCSASVLV